MELGSYEYESDDEELIEEEEEINNDNVDIDIVDENEINQHGIDGKELLGDERRGSELKKITIFEVARVISLRAFDFYNGIRPNLSDYEIAKIGITNVVNLAIEEFLQGRLPKYVVRKYPDGYFEKWKLNEFRVFPNIKDLKSRKVKNFVTYYTDYQIKELEKFGGADRNMENVDEIKGPIELEMSYKISDELWEKISETNRLVMLQRKAIQDLYNEL